MRNHLALLFLWTLIGLASGESPAGLAQVTVAVLDDRDGVTRSCESISVFEKRADDKRRRSEHDFSSSFRGCTASAIPFGLYHVRGRFVPTVDRPYARRGVPTTFEGECRVEDASAVCVVIKRWPECTVLDDAVAELAGSQTGSEVWLSSNSIVVSRQTLVPFDGRSARVPGSIDDPNAAITFFVNRRPVFSFAVDLRRSRRVLIEHRENDSHPWRVRSEAAGAENGGAKSRLTRLTVGSISSQGQSVDGCDAIQDFRVERGAVVNVPKKRSFRGCHATDAFAGMPQIEARLTGETGMLTATCRIEAPSSVCVVLSPRLIERADNTLQVNITLPPAQLSNAWLSIASPLSAGLLSDGPRISKLGPDGIVRFNRVRALDIVATLMIDGDVVGSALLDLRSTRIHSLATDRFISSVPTTKLN